MNRVQTLKKLMTEALSEPIVMTLSSEKEARAWRWTCYHIRQVEPLYAKLKFKVAGSKLTMEMKE